MFINPFAVPQDVTGVSLYDPKDQDLGMDSSSSQNKYGPGKSTALRSLDLSILPNDYIFTSG